MSYGREKNKDQRGYVEEASPQNRDKLVELFNKILEINVLQAHKRKLASKAFKNIVARAFISKREATLIIGALRKTIQKAALRV